jgi:hypothetical protein
VTVGGRALVVIAVVGLLGLFGPVSGAAATTRTRVLPATKTSSFALHGSGRWYVEVTARATGGGPPKVTFEAVEERYKVEQVSIAYSRRGRWLGDGGFAAKLPGIGQVSMRFDQQQARKSWTFQCGVKPAHLRRGEFTGTISFRGERGFTTTKATAAKGQVQETKRQTCNEKVVEPGVEPAIGPQAPYLHAAGSSDGGSVYFYVAGAPTPQPQPSGAIGEDVFEARYTTHRRGIEIAAGTFVDSGPALFFVPGWPATLTEATAEPPKPFTDKGIFHLESPTASSWTGGLGIDFPGVGHIALTGPGIAAQICEGLTCSGPPLPTA